MNKILLLISTLIILLALITLFILGIKNKSNQHRVNIPTASMSPSVRGSLPEASPIIVFSNPANNDTNVPVNSSVTFVSSKRFNENSTKVTFNPSVQFKSDYFGNSLNITPVQPLSKDATYQVTISLVSLNFQYTISFITSNQQTNGSIGPDQKSIQAGENFIRAERPDIFLTNNIPYSNNQFSIDQGGFKTDHYSFVVLVKTNRQSTQISLDNWLKSLGLTTNQIQNLDITYR